MIAEIKLNKAMTYDGIILYVTVYSGKGRFDCSFAYSSGWRKWYVHAFTTPPNLNRKSENNAQTVTVLPHFLNLKSPQDEINLKMRVMSNKTQTA